MLRIDPRPVLPPVRSAAPSRFATLAAVAASGDVNLASGWERKAYMPLNPAAEPPADALARGRAVFSISEAKSKAEATQVGDFFKRYPSRGGDEVAVFHAYWAQHQTFQHVPLQAYLYSKTRPTDDAGRPKNALWQRYATLVETGASPAAIEAAFYKAHITEFKQVVRTPEFKALYAVATPKYRKVVEAYLDTLSESEKALASGENPLETGRKHFPRTVVALARQGVKDQGFMATWQGVKAFANPTDPLTQQVLRAAREIAGTLLVNAPAERPDPTKVMVSLSAAEATRLRAQTGIPFKAGRQELTEAMLAKSAVAEPERRANPTTPRPTVRLKLSDFLAPDPMHTGLFRAGADGVMNAQEIEGVVGHVQGLVRSQLIEDFYKRYPIAHAGVHTYSANMLSMNGAYANSEMAQTLANAIMPVDNDGKPKNADWQAYADACDSHAKVGSPSTQVLESLWWKAHMIDFQIVDTPKFQTLLKDFFKREETDPGLKPLGTYARAMVWGRQNFEKDRHLRSEDAAFGTFIRHFTATIVKDGSMPFWRQDLDEAKAWLKDPNAPDLDDRGLPTPHALAERTAEGLKQMMGLRGTIVRGAWENLKGTDERLPASQMIDLTKILTPQQLKQVDPRILTFYKDPTTFDVRAGVETSGGWLGKLLLGKVASLATGLAKLPDRTNGFEDFPVEMSLYKDDAGGTHWDRYVVVDGERQPLFLGRFEQEGKQFKETFTVRGKSVTLFFDVNPHQGGLQLTLDKKKSSHLADLSTITFTVLPTATGLVTTGRYDAPIKQLNQTFTMKMTPKAS